MAANFKINFQKNAGSVYLMLEGDFDGSSAQQLLYWMRHARTEKSRVVIDTSALERIEPFGLNVFHYNLGSLKNHARGFIFMGPKARLFTDQWPAAPRPSRIVEYGENMSPGFV